MFQLSYADTHPMFTSDNFPNFYRVVPSENAFNAPRLKLMQHFNWTRVGTIYQNEPSGPGDRKIKREETKGAGESDYTVFHSERSPSTTNSLTRTMGSPRPDQLLSLIFL
ncbi:unnamed protein product [Nezara viridula]|uniref:Receptor ligand binding region domain-containing protein n=1 Tax=Nezara viridula TaxID=85310 RepID=A0A9P0H3G9_NEZVI|nr:unnamed protein product [Nezara viridula]